MITSLGNVGGEEIPETPQPQRENLMGKRATVTRGPRAGKTVEVISEIAGTIIAIWTDEKGQQHRFAAPSNIFQPIVTRKRTKRARKPKK